jgi:hypothetical protein
MPGVRLYDDRLVRRIGCKSVSRERVRSYLGDWKRKPLDNEKEITPWRVY